MNNRKLRVLHFGLSANRGGIETYLYKLAKNIDLDCFSFSFIDTNKGRPCFYDELLELNCNFFKVTPRRSSITKNKSDIENIFANNYFDIFHFHVNTLSYIEPVLAALRHDVKVIVHSRNAGTAGSVATRLLHTINGYRLPRGKISSIAVSSEAGKWLFGKKSDYKVYNNGIDLDFFRYSISRGVSFRDSLHIDRKELLIGHVGAFLPAKNQNFVVDIFSKILDKRPHAKLVLIGSGEGLDSTQAHVNSLGLSHCVVFAGSRSDMANALSAIDLFIFPSFYEGFPNAVLEAQACGVPCIVSDKVTPEVLLRMNCRSMSLDKSAEDWAAKGLSLLEIENTREEAYNDLSAAGFSVEQEIKHMQDLYFSLV